MEIKNNTKTLDKKLLGKKAIIDVYKNNKDILENGNSETTAAETAESEIENAEKKKMKGGEA